MGPLLLSLLYLNPSAGLRASVSCADAVRWHCVMSVRGLSGTNAMLLLLGFRVADTPVRFHLDSGGCWLLLFGLLPAIFASMAWEQRHYRNRPKVTGWQAFR